MPNEPNKIADDKYPAPCPGCREIQGFPAEVSTDGLHGIHIVMKCHACGHEWRVHRNVIPMFGRHRMG